MYVFNSFWSWLIQNIFHLFLFYFNLLQGLIYSFLNCSEINSHISSLFFLDNRYTFLFLGTNPSFILIVWSYSFLVGILSLAFLLKIWIHLWNLSGTSFFISSSDFTVSFSSSQIYYSSIIFFTSIILFFFCFLFSFFSCFFFSHFISSSSFFFFSFCFSHPNFSCFGLYCFLYFSGHLIIFTSSVLQLISGLWWASHSISKITLYSYFSITFISVLSLCPW